MTALARRHQLAVHSPITLAGLVRALPALARGESGATAPVRRELESRLDARVVALTDSGTSALVIALRLAVGAGGTVAFPGYACVDLVAAALYAGVRVRLYDLDPRTLSPDLDSVRAVLARGVDAVLVSHLFGYPADVPEVAALAAEHGARVIEDAAQGAGGTLAGRPLGGLGALSILSFGRGKGTTGGAGGALVANDAAWVEPVREAAARLAPGGRGAGDWAKAVVQWALGRPSLYWIPASIPALALGEMVYHPAHEPTAMAGASASVLRTALRLDAAEVAWRRRNAGRLEHALAHAPGLSLVRPVANGASGYLRLAVLAPDREAASRLGVMRVYPRTLFEMPETASLLLPGEREQAGALELRRALLGVPTHRFVTDGDIARVARHLAGTARDVTAGLAAAGPDLSA